MLYPRTLHRADPFALMRRLSQDIDRISGAAAQAFPPVNVWQNEEAAAITAEMPGMDMQDIEVSVSADLLTVRGEKRVERQEEKQGYYLSERSYGAIYRAIPLPPGVDGDKAEATFRNGVLTIRLPQTPESQTRVKQIEIRTP